MNKRTRLALVGVIILGSSVYGVLVNRNPNLAESLAVGYCAILLTILVLINVWKDGGK